MNYNTLGFLNSPGTGSIIPAVFAMAACRIVGDYFADIELCAYCLDAPSWLPAGGCQNNPPQDSALLVSRETLS